MLVQGRLYAPPSITGAGNGGGNQGPRSPNANRSFVIGDTLRSGSEVMSLRLLNANLDGLGYHALALQVTRIALGEVKPSADDMQKLQAEIRQIASTPQSTPELELKREAVAKLPKTVGYLESLAGKFANNVYLLNIAGVYSGHIEGQEAQMWSYFKAAEKVDPQLPNLLYNLASKKALHGHKDWAGPLAKCLENCADYEMDAEKLKAQMRNDKDFIRVRNHPDFVRLTRAA